MCSCSDPRDYLKHVMKATNMSCLTPEGATSGDCDFLSANMYARSLFGESFLFFIVMPFLTMLLDVIHRRGCSSESKHREDGGGKHHGPCSDSQ